jgi:hypothetical protein
MVANAKVQKVKKRKEKKKYSSLVQDGGDRASYIQPSAT